jgi:NADPH:quinone reductase-like Zn-dependent oxidoreductase
VCLKIEKMKAVIYNKQGSPDKFIYCDVDKPMPDTNEILIKIHAVSLNAADYRAAKLGIIPKKKIFGADISGIIESVGKDVSGFKIGDEVIGCLIHHGYGGLAEYVAVSEKAVIKKPEQLSFEEASTLPVAGITAIQALRNKGNVQKGYKVLIVGCSGSVGTFAVQLAKHFGAVVTGVCSTKNIQQTLSLGADYVIDYTQVDFAKQNMRYDIILGVNGNYPLLSYMKTLAKNGIYVSVGGSLLQVFKSILFGWLLSFGNKKIKFVAARELNSDLKILADLVVNGSIRPVIVRRYPLEKTADAMNYLNPGHSSGKVVINIHS